MRANPSRWTRSLASEKPTPNMLYYSRVHRCHTRTRQQVQLDHQAISENNAWPCTVLYVPPAAPICPLINLTTDLDPVREVKSSRKLCSNPKKFDSRIVQPITIQLISSFGWPNICGMPTATINGRYGDPVIIRRDLDVFRTGREDGGLHNVGVTVQNEGRERNARDDRVRDGGGEEGYLSVW